jgi:hypothetical protein
VGSDLQQFDGGDDPVVETDNFDGGGSFDVIFKGISFDSEPSLDVALVSTPSNFDEELRFDVNKVPTEQMSNLTKKATYVKTICGFNYVETDKPQCMSRLSEEAMSKLQGSCTNN